jgi:RNA polymerase sigma-70 factor (sigma-E family)
VGVDWRSRGEQDARWDPAFERFVGRSSATLLRSAFLLAGDRGVAEDLVQQALLRVAGRWEAARLAPEAYARQVLVNLCRDRYRREARQGGTAAAVGPRNEDEVRDLADAVADRDEVIAALGRLSLEHREVLVLRFFADLSVAEVAAAIDGTEGTVKSRTSRALARMRELLGEPRRDEHERARIEVGNDD